eukprot:3629478-Rhodomonas_salina.1
MSLRQHSATQRFAMRAPTAKPARMVEEQEDWWFRHFAKSHSFSVSCPVSFLSTPASAHSLPLPTAGLSCNTSCNPGPRREKSKRQPPFLSPHAFAVR